MKKLAIALLVLALAASAIFANGAAEAGAPANEAANAADFFDELKGGKDDS